MTGSYHVADAAQEPTTPFQLTRDQFYPHSPCVFACVARTEAKIDANALLLRLVDWHRTLADYPFRPVLQVLACAGMLSWLTAAPRRTPQLSAFDGPKVPRGRPRTLTSSQSR